MACVVRACAFLAVLAAHAPAADPLAVSVRVKFDLIENGRVPRGSDVVLTPAEMNAWTRENMKRWIPQGLRNPSLQFGDGTLTASALVDFLKMRQAVGQETGWAISKLIQGERPLKIFARLESGGGRCTVYLTRVELSGVAATGSVLDFLIRNFFRPQFPDAKINEPFDLAYDMERIEVRASGARVRIKK